VFYINPSRRGPVTPDLPDLAGIPGKGPKWAFSGIFPIFGENGQFRTPQGVPEIWAPGGAPDRGQGPAARG